MIKVKIMHPDFGDVPDEMEPKQLAQFLHRDDVRSKVQFVKFSDDTVVTVQPKGSSIPFLDTAALTHKLKGKDGQEAVLVPKVGGG